MPSYMIRGLPEGAIQAFKKKCRETLVSPEEVLRALIVHTDPQLVPDIAETRIAHRLSFHHIKHEEPEPSAHDEIVMKH